MASEALRACKNIIVALKDLLPSETLSIMDPALLQDMEAVTYPWVQVLDNEVSIWTADIPTSIWRVLRANIFIPGVKPAQVISLLFDNDRVAEYDDMHDRAIILENGEDFVVKRSCAKGIWPTTARDFVVLSTIRPITAPLPAPLSNPPVVAAAASSPSPPPPPTSRVLSPPSAIANTLSSDSIIISEMSDSPLMSRPDVFITMGPGKPIPLDTLNDLSKNINKWDDDSESEGEEDDTHSQASSTKPKQKKKLKFSLSPRFNRKKRLEPINPDAESVSQPSSSPVHKSHHQGPLSPKSQPTPTGRTSPTWDNSPVIHEVVNPQPSTISTSSSQQAGLEEVIPTLVDRFEKGL